MKLHKKVNAPANWVQGKIGFWGLTCLQRFNPVDRSIARRLLETSCFSLMTDDAVSRSIFGIFFSARIPRPFGAKASSTALAAARRPPKATTSTTRRSFMSFFVFCVGEDERTSKCVYKEDNLTHWHPTHKHVGKSFVAWGTIPILCQPLSHVVYISHHKIRN